MTIVVSVARPIGELVETRRELLRIATILERKLGPGLLSAASRRHHDVGELGRALLDIESEAGRLLQRAVLYGGRLWWSPSVRHASLHLATALNSRTAGGADRLLEPNAGDIASLQVWHAAVGDLIARLLRLFDGADVVFTLPQLRFYAVPEWWRFHVEVQLRAIGLVAELLRQEAEGS